MMASKWRKAKLALGLNLCYYGPRSKVEDDDVSFSGAAGVDECSSSMPVPVPPPLPSTSSGKLLKSSTMSSSQKICSICLGTMKLGEGQAIFTAECTHSFHFHCITSSVKHGNQVCPICRANWKEIPHQSPPANLPTIMPQDDTAVMTLIRRLPPSILVRPPASLRSPEPAVYNDDESLVVQLDAQPVATSDDITSSNLSATDRNTNNTIEIKTYPEFSSLERRKPYDYFTILIHLKAPMAINTLQNPRTPVDLVTILDISGSMSGTKLTLLKRAMGFVIQNLTPNDRLSVIAFSSTARRLFPLRRMSDTGRQHALHSINTLTANGATNIAEGLRKGVKVMEQRREKNPVASIILLSDGQDTCTLNGFGVVGSSRRKTERNYRLLLPVSMQQGKESGLRIPIHTFGFGADHDAGSMHSISECTGGMFSFIESEIAIQDAFAQCIGGILSVVVQNLQVGIECCCCTHDLGGRLLSIKAGSYPSSVNGDGRSGSIDVGDLYADEERDFLISMAVPPEFNSNSSSAGKKASTSTSTSTSLLRVKCEFTDPRTNKLVTLYGDELKIERNDEKGNREVCLEVDRQRNRVWAAEIMTEARSAAERGDLGGAIDILEECRSVIAGTKSGKCGGDKMCVGLDAEMKEMQERMESKKVYEKSGRAYVLSGLSSHSWQRATVRGDSSGGEAYQTPSMVEMVSRSRSEMFVDSSTG